MEIEMIDDQFWLKYAKEHTEKAIDLANAGADKLDTFLTWAWGIYTTAFTATIILNLVSDDYASRIIMALPVVVIPFAKFLCIRVQMPVYARFYPDVPDSIVQDLYSAIINKKHQLFRWAIIISAFGILNIGMALFIFKMGTNDIYKIKTTHIENNHTLSISGKISKNKIASITVLGKLQDTAYKSIDFKIQADKAGDIDTMISDQGLKSVTKVYCKWDIENGNSKIIDN